ncbi:MAG TPA: nicotinic acid mononucleotide adenylyltransferase [Flavobacteriales bacterium]|nr:nicotinic acid mononucleotide adenylyltransferase [Flavobacteriales bacterium]
MKVGLFFGTYNPIHVGHLIIANYMVQYTDLDRVWMVVSPQNPLKKRETLLEDFHRINMVREAIDQNPLLWASDVEFHLEKPSYTVNTLAHLQEQYPDHEFTLIMGEDNLRTFHKWRNFNYILEYHSIIVYPRVYTEQEKEQLAKKENRFEGHPKIQIVHAPVLKVSSSLIRRMIGQGKDPRYLLTPEVYRYVDEMNFYRS